MNHIDLAIQQGECLLLCGESSCRKTTITKLINRLIPHFTTGDKLSGTVRVINETTGKEFSNAVTVKTTEIRKPQGVKGYEWLDEATGNINYASNGFSDLGANGTYQAAQIKGTIGSIAEIPGLAVWMDGHIS